MAGRDEKKVESALARIKGAAGADMRATLSTVQLDVIDEKSIQRAAATVERDYGHLDALINNAGVTSAVEDIRTRWQGCMETNVLGPALVSAAFRPLLLKSRNPYSIFISSGVGSLTSAAGPDSLSARFPNGEMYRASKAALNMVMLNEHAKFKNENLKTIAIDPGLVVSNLRGNNETARTAGGKAGDPVRPANLVLSVLEGKQDAQTGKHINEDGPVAW